MNELYTSYTLSDGRVLEAKRGKVSAQIGYESHGMFVMKFKHDWGPYTYTSVALDYCPDYDVPLDEQVRLPEPFLYPLIVAMLKVFNVDYFESIRDAEVYILFSEEEKLHNVPLGFVNVKDTQNAFIFDDFFEEHTGK
jgi:hypothetical protein